MKNVRVILSPDAEEVYKHLNEEAPKSKTEQTILNAINKKVELIKVNPHYGNPIAKKLIPQEYKDTYDEQSFQGRTSQLLENALYSD